MLLSPCSQWRKRLRLQLQNRKRKNCRAIQAHMVSSSEDGYSINRRKHMPALLDATENMSSWISRVGTRLVRMSSITWPCAWIMAGLKLSTDTFTLHRYCSKKSEKTIWLKELIEVSDTVTVLWEANKTTLFNLSYEPFNYFHTIIFSLTLFNFSSVRE